MKTKAMFMTALILVPTAGAAAVQAAPAPAQDFRVSYTKAVPLTSSSVFSKTNLPQVLSDEELDKVTGENPAIVAEMAWGAATGAGTYVVSKLIDGEKPTVKGTVAAAAVGAVAAPVAAARAAAAVATGVASKAATAINAITSGVLGGAIASGTSRP